MLRLAITDNNANLGYPFPEFLDLKINDEKSMEISENLIEKKLSKTSTSIVKIKPTELA